MDTKKITHLMKERDMTPYRLSKVSGISTSRIYDLLDGKHDNWRILSVIKVAMALNVSVDEVLLDKYKHKGDKL